MLRHQAHGQEVPVVLELSVVRHQAHGREVLELLELPVVLELLVVVEVLGH